MSDEVLLEEADGILTVTINRPAAKNAINRAVAEGIAAAMDKLDSTPSLRVGILTGAGGVFCSGMDLKAFLGGDFPSVEGRGFGGLELLLACDLAVASESTRLGIPEAKRGLAAAAGGLVRLPRLVPYRVALEMALTGDMISAARAYEIGLLNRVVPAGEALSAAQALARAIVANGPLSVAASKRIMRDQASWPADELWARQNDIVMPVFASNDAREGASAFAEKRAPAWSGT